MGDFLWNFPSQLPKVNEDNQGSPTDIGWGDDRNIFSEVKEEMVEAS